MSGLAGDLETWFQKSRLAAFFRAQGTSVVGIAYRQQELCYVKLRVQSGDLTIDFAGKESCTVESATDVMEQVHLYLAKHGWQECPIAWGLSGEDVLLYAPVLPPGMNEEECHASARWEMDAWLADKGNDSESFAIGTRIDAESQCTAVAVQKSDIEMWENACVAAGFSLTTVSALAPRADGLVITADGLRVGGRMISFAREADVKLLQTMSTALAAALSAVGAGEALGIRVWGMTLSRTPWNVGKIASFVACLTCFLILVTSVVDVWHLYEARQQLEQKEAQLANVVSDKKGMKLVQEKQEELHRKDAALQDLSAHSFPWYSVLVHLGTPAMCVDGVWLDGIDLRDSVTIELQGSAVSYEALSEYVTAFEQDTAFFPNGAILEESDLVREKEKGNTDGVIHFRMVLRL